MDLLAVGGAKAGGTIPVLFLDVEGNDRIRPIEQVWNDTADTLPGAGWGLEEDVFRSAEAEHCAVFSAEQ
jgi:hypothetical protein